MVSAKLKPTTKYAVTFAVEGSKLETVAKKIKDAVGDVKVLSVEKVAIPGVGEWGTEWVQPEGHRDPKLVNTDGRTIRRVEDYKEWDSETDKPVESSKVTYYEVRDSYGKQISADDGSKYGKWHIETLEEAKSLVRVPLTQAEILATADTVAAHVVKYGAVDKTKDHEEATLAQKAAESYLMGRGKTVPEEYFEEEGKGYRSAPEYIVTLRIKASTLPAVEKKAKAMFGEKLVSVEKVGRGFSRAVELAEAEEHVKEAAEIVGELLSDMEERRDNTPENFQQGETYEMVESAVDSLEQLKGELDGLDFDSVEFPGFCQ